MPSTPQFGLDSTRPRSARGRKPAPALNQPGRPTAAELERRVTRIMTVATDLFVRHGYAGTALIDIARGAGVGTRTIYQHIGDKEGLFREVILARDAIGAITPPTLQSGDTLFAAMERTARYMLDYAMVPRSVDLMRLMIAESKRFPNLLSGVGNAAFARFRRDLAAIFDELSAAGIIPDGDNDDRAHLYVDVILGTIPILTYAEWLRSPPTDSYIHAPIDFFLRGAFGAAIADAARTLSVNMGNA